MHSLFSISNCRCLMNISQSKFSLLTTYLAQNSNVPCLSNQPPRHLLPQAFTAPAVGTRAHSFGQFKKHVLLKARTQSPCFSYPGLSRAFQSAGSADLLSFGGDRVSLMPGAQFTVLQYICTVGCRFVNGQKCGRYIC
jgi:hypothetical protein